MDIDISSKRFNNLTKEERDALYNLRDDPTIIIKGTGKGSAVAAWDRDDYLKEAPKQLNDKDVYEEVQSDPNTLINTIMRTLEKIRIRGDLSNDTISYFLVKDLKFAKFYLLPKIHKRFHNVPGRPVMSNCKFCTENISSFQGRSEGTSSVTFEVPIIKSEIDFVNLFIFNCLTSNENLFIFNCLTLNINLFNLMKLGKMMTCYLRDTNKFLRSRTMCTNILK